MDFFNCLSDATIGPVVRGCRHDFDFTLEFEKIFLSAIPASLFLALAVARSLRLIRKPRLVQAHILQFIKLRSARPSILLSIYLSLAVLFDIVQTRSLWLAAVTSSDRTYTILFTSATVVRSLLILTESIGKSKGILWNTERHSPEETAGLPSLVSFFWLNSLLRTGYYKQLSADDLFPLDSAIVSESLGKKLNDSINASPTSGRRFGLGMLLAKLLIIPLLIPVGPRLALLGFRLCQPFLINSILTYLESPVGKRPPDVGYGLIGGTILIYFGIAISSALYRYYHERALWMARGALASAVYRRTTQSKLSAADDSAALTLMSTDIERIRLGLLALHDFWACILQVGLALFLLFRVVGAAFAAPVVVVAICSVCITAVSRLSGKFQKVWMEKIQKRVGVTSNMVGKMKSLKISGMTGSMESIVQQLRLDEVKAGSNFRATMVLAFVVGFAPSMIAPIVTLGLTVQTLDVTRIFTAMSILSLVTDPLSQIFQYIPPFLASITCLGRIQTFLEKDTWKDFRRLNIREKLSMPNTDHTTEKPAPIVEVKDGSFGWENEKLVLRNISFSLPASELTIVVGPLASGKSTLLKALLGEASIFGGQITLNSACGRIGYCDQDPFLTNATIRENIVAFSPFNSSRYNEVLEASMLVADLAILPDGDSTKIGSQGVALSGGQKKRVALARALYLESDLLMIDDIFSGLDADTEDGVFRKAFGQDGLVRRRDATAIVCTHSVRHLPFADHIIALGEDGSIVEQGSFQDLVVNERYVHGLGVKTLANANTQKTTEPLLDSTETSEERAGSSPLMRISTADSSAPSSIYGASRPVTDATVYKYYANSMNLPILFFFILCGFAAGFFFNFPQVWLSYWSADAMAHYVSHTRAYWVGLYALWLLLCLVCLGTICWVVFIIIIRQSGTTLHYRLLRTVTSAGLRFFTKTDAGIVTNLFSQDLALIDMQLPMALLNTTVGLSICIGMAVVVATASPYVAIAYPFLVAVLWFIQRFYLRTSRQLRLLDLEAKRSLRAFRWVESNLEVNNTLLDNSQRPAYLLAMIQRWLTFILYNVVAVLATTIVVLTTQARSITGMGFTGASLVTLMSFGDYVSQLIMAYTMLETSIGAVSRIKSFNENVHPESSSNDEIEPPETWPAKGTIEINGVSASYRSPRSTGAMKTMRNRLMVLTDLNLNVAAGEKIAICGRTGSGKSSLILLLLRLLDPVDESTENLVIDGVPLCRVDRSTLRRRIIAVSQDPIFLPDGNSFKLNLDPLGTSTDNECREVLESVALWDSVQKHGGLDKAMSANMLSLGQKHLFGFARAVLRKRIRARKPPALGGFDQITNKMTVQEREKSSSNASGGGLLLLDEPNSAVDKETDKRIQALIMQEFAGYTVIMVSHRLHTVVDFDRVVIMEKSTMVETGRPHDLLKQPESRFSKLWSIEKQHEESS
ncbi:hypothetical protein ACHAQJ_009306 [Trichoderma viride]